MAPIMPCSDLNVGDGGVDVEHPTPCGLLRSECGFERLNYGQIERADLSNGTDFGASLKEGVWWRR
jgi:hypothetical protein